MSITVEKKKELQECQMMSKTQKKIVEIGLKSHYFVKDKLLSCFCLLL